MVAPIAASCSSARWTVVLRWLGLPLLCLLLLVAAAPATSQDGEELLPHEAAPPREAASLEVVVNPRPDLSADLGETATVPAVVTNTGNITALGVVAGVEDAGLLEGTPVNVGDIAPGAQVALELPVVVAGRSAFPLPFAVRATAANVEYPAIVTAEQTFAAPDSGLYLPGLNRARVLLERRRERYDAGNPVGRTLLWVELSNPNIDNRPAHVNLHRLLRGQVPDDLTLRALYYPTELSTPQELPITYNPAGARLDLVLPGPGRYLIEWTRDEAAGEATPLAVAAAEPDLPQGWTPSYHAPLVSEFTGSVTLQFPIVTPPGAAGLQPNLGLSYSSANGNGMVGRLQADETGFGWTNNALIDVTQALDACQDNVCVAQGDIDGNPNTNDPYDPYTLSFGGAGYELVHINGKAVNGQPGRYYAQGHAGLYIELCKAPLSAYCAFLPADNNNMEYTQSNVVWRITGPDGTTYRLGARKESEQEIIRPGDFTRDEEEGARNLALRWRVDTVVDRFGNKMIYKYDEDFYTNWDHSEYFHTPASYLSSITYDNYRIEFDHVQLPYEAYRTQGYGYSISYQTRRLAQVRVMTGTQKIRHYSLTHDYQRYGHDNDTDHPLEDPNYGVQSPWCAAFNYVLDFKNSGNPDDNVTYVPHKMPVLLSIHEGGSNGAAKSGTPDTTFSYVFLGTGQYDHAAAGPHLRYCFPYLDTVETIYGPIDPAIPTTAYAWRDENSANPPTQSYGGLLGQSYLGRYVNVIERETAHSGFADAPNLESYFTYASPNLQGDKNTFQGFATVDRCRGAACSGTWTRKETLSFLTRAYYAGDAALTGRAWQRDVRAYSNTLAARTEYTWAMLDGDGVGGADPTRVAVLTQQIERDYRGGEAATRATFVYDVYGNRTQTQEFGQLLTGDAPKRTLERLYAVNTNVGSNRWLVNLPWRETLWDGPTNGAAAKIVRRTHFRYDNTTCANAGAAPTQGLLRAEDHYVPGSGNNLGCSGTDWLTTTYSYGGLTGDWWQLTLITDPGSRQSTFTWANDTQLSKVTTAIGDVKYTYDTVFRWQVSQVTQPNGAKTQYTYDVHGRLKAVKRPDPVTGNAVPRTIEYVYGDTGNPIYVEQKDWGVHATTPPTTHTFYDALGRPLQERHWNVSDDFTVAFIDTHYDKLGRVSCVTPLMSDAGAGGSFNNGIVCANQARTLYAYDVLDEVTTVTGIDDKTTVTTVAGRERRVKDAGDKTTVYLYDDLGRLVKVTQPTVAGGAPVMSYTYDLADTLLTAKGPDGDTATMVYDKLGRKTSMNDPDMGAWSYAYDGSGNLARQTDAKNQRLRFYYDLGGRLTAKTHDGSGATACPATAGGTSLATYSYHTSGAGKGLLSGVSGGSGVGAFSDAFTYDYRGRVMQQTRTINNVPFTRSAGYDAADRPLSVMYPSGEMVSYGYNGQYPKSLDTVLPGPAMELVTDLTYNQRGQLVWLSRGPNAWAVPDTGYTYDTKAGNFRLKQIKHGSDSDAFPDFLYDTHDAMGRVTKLITDVGATTETQTFGYDAIGRLTTAALTGASTANFSYAYSYDRAGNILSRTGTDPDLLTYDYGDRVEAEPIPDLTGGPHAVTYVDVGGTANDWRYDYDARGNLDDKYEGSTRTHDYTFDVEGRLASVRTNNETTTFFYDADGQRILTDRPGDTFVYTPFPDFEREVAGSVVTERTTYTLAGQLIGVRVKVNTGSNEVYYTYTDHLGSVAAMSWAGGTFRDGSLARYDPFGNYRTWPGSNVNPLIFDRGFTGHVHDNTGPYPTQNVGLIYMNARYYLPEVGRFISADTIVPEPEEPQSFNRYSYSFNNPINYTDPSGHCAGNPDGVGNSFDENLCWSNVATIGNLWEHTDYWKERWGSYEDFVLNVGSNPLLGTDFFSDELLRYTQSDQYKVWSAQLASSYPPSPPPLDTGEYWVLSLTTPLPFPLFLGFKVIRDDWGVWYFNVHEAGAPGFSIMRGQIFVNNTTKPTDAKALADFPSELQADLAQSVLPGISGGASAGWFLVGGGVNVAEGSNAHVYVEGGLYRPGVSSEIGYTFVAPWLR